MSSLAPFAAIVAADFSDPGRARLIYLAAAALVALGLITVATTVWWWRQTRPDHPSLGPLMVMSHRRWRSLGDVEQAESLDAARPDGASRGAAERDAAEPVDLSLAPGDHVLSFDDLREEAVDVPVVDDPVSDDPVSDDGASNDAAADVVDAEASSGDVEVADT